MKKSKQIFSTFILMVTLFFTSVAATNVYADSTDPQGTVNSIKAPPPPPPPLSSQTAYAFDEDEMFLIWLWINGVYF